MLRYPLSERTSVNMRTRLGRHSMIHQLSQNLQIEVVWLLGLLWARILGCKSWPPVAAYRQTAWPFKLAGPWPHTRRLKTTKIRPRPRNREWFWAQPPWRTTITWPRTKRSTQRLARQQTLSESCLFRQSLTSVKRRTRPMGIRKKKKYNFWMGRVLQN